MEFQEAIRELETQPPDQEITARFGFQAGRFVAGRIDRELRVALDVAGVEYELTQYKGFLECSFSLVLKGMVREIHPILVQLGSWFEEQHRPPR